MIGIGVSTFSTLSNCRSACTKDDSSSIEASYCLGSIVDSSGCMNIETSVDSYTLLSISRSDGT